MSIVRRSGVGNKIMEAITSELADAPCFATTRTNNGVIRRMMLKYGLRKSGDDYPSKKGDYSLMLFLRIRDASGSECATTSNEDAG